MKLKRQLAGDYASPAISIVTVTVERGFASSILGGGADDDGWFGGNSTGSGINGADREDDGYFE